MSAEQELDADAIEQELADVYNALRHVVTWLDDQATALEMIRALERSHRELNDVYNDLFWVVPEALDESGEEMTAQRKIQVLARGYVAHEKLREYDLKHGIESDAHACLAEEPSQSSTPVAVAFVEDSARYVSPREARCLAASLLRAADEAEKAGAQ